MKAAKVKGLDPRAPFRSNVSKVIATRLDELLSFAETALEPGASEAQHDMRIAVKRLRYALEIGAGCFGPEAERARGAAAKLQSALGEIHDCDVMSERVAEQVEQLRAEDVGVVVARADQGKLDPGAFRNAPNRTAYRGLGMLAIHFDARRALLFGRFAELWAEQRASEVWSELSRAVR